MTELPNPINLEKISADDILSVLVDRYNDLLSFVAEKDGQRHDGWDWVLINPTNNHIESEGK